VGGTEEHPYQEFKVINVCYILLAHNSLDFFGQTAVLESKASSVRVATFSPFKR
jgi:hypothetical protein